MTGNRFYLVILAAWLTLSMVLMETKRYNNYRFLLLFGIVVIAVFTYIPGITAHDFGKWSQRAVVKDLASQYGTFNEEGTLIAYDDDGAQVRREASVKYLENEKDSVWLLEHIGYSSKREMMYGVKLDYKIEDTYMRVGEYTQGENERLPIENYAYLIFNPHTSLDTTSGQFIVQLSDSVEMVLNRDAINKLHRELCYYKVDKLPLSQFRVIQNDTIVYFDRINYSDTKINRLYIKAVFIP